MNRLFRSFLFAAGCLAARILTDDTTGGEPSENPVTATNPNTANGGRIPQDPERQFQAVDHGRRRETRTVKGMNWFSPVDGHVKQHGADASTTTNRLRDGHRGLFPRGQGRRTLVFPRSGRRRRHPARHSARAPRHLGRNIRRHSTANSAATPNGAPRRARCSPPTASTTSPTVRTASNASRTTCAKTCSTPASARWPTPRTSTCCAPSWDMTANLGYAFRGRHLQAASCWRSSPRSKLRREPRPREMRPVRRRQTLRGLLPRQRTALRGLRTPTP